MQLSRTEDGDEGREVHLVSAAEDHFRSSECIRDEESLSSSSQVAFPLHQHMHIHRTGFFSDVGHDISVISNIGVGQ